MTPKLTKYIPHKPHPPQAAFLLLDHVREALFGGAAGGGKSDALLMGALQYVDVPGYAALLLRRKFTDLNQPDALIPRSKEWLLKTDARWNQQDHQWTFPGGAVVKFGYLEHEDDVYQYQGAAFQFVGFDELTQFSFFQFDYLNSRIRRKEEMKKSVPLRMRASANPGGIGHEWVANRFFVEGREKGRVFVPSKLEDNPSLDREDYEKQLEAISDPVLRAQLRHGDWTVRPAGAMFRREWFKIVDAPPAGLRWQRYWDLAATEAKKGKDPDWTAGAKVAVERDKATKSNRIWVAGVDRTRSTPGDVERLIRQTAFLDGKGVPVWIEQEPGSSGVNTVDNYVRRVLFGFHVRGDKVTGPKQERWRALSAQAQAGNVYLVRGAWNSWWLEEAQAAPNPGVHDDGLDAVSGALDKFLNFTGDPWAGLDESSVGERRM